MASTVMACYSGQVRPGYNRLLLGVVEYAKRQAIARGWAIRIKGRIREDGTQVIDVYLLADI